MGARAYQLTIFQYQNLVCGKYSSNTLSYH